MNDKCVHCYSKDVPIVGTPICVDCWKIKSWIVLKSGTKNCLMLLDKELYSEEKE